MIGIKSGKHAFPCEIADDPLLELVLSTKEHFDHAEERRLFYVALTRTKNTIFVVGDSMAESTFFKELMEDPDVDTSHLGHAINRRCPKCQAMMMEKKGDFGPFFGCSNYPICHFSTKPCFSCRIGFLINNEDQMKCDNADCQKIYEICPRCKSGALVERKGKHGLFLGCTNYFTMDECSYSRNVGKLIRKNI
ncbi:MAG: topoisomerase DNA-binding C4 zinc finger domain-containing protein [Neisseriales bacterium]|nr:MAG: topoisomerase DNA-binding C4 zinc finger domain-containing protein [Neisseriales bacterium]